MRDLILLVVSVCLYVTVGILMESVLKVKEYWKYGIVFYALGMMIGTLHK